AERQRRPRKAGDPMRHREELNPTSDVAGKPPGPCAMVIFGASGDLTKRKLIPALYNLAKEKLLPKDFAVIGFASSEMATESYREKASQDLRDYAASQVDGAFWDWFKPRLYYIAGDFRDANAYAQLKSLLAQLDKDHNSHGNYLYYLAVAPTYFA